MLASLRPVEPTSFVSPQVIILDDGDDDCYCTGVIRKEAVSPPTSFNWPPTTRFAAAIAAHLPYDNEEVVYLSDDDDDDLQFVRTYRASMSAPSSPSSNWRDYDATDDFGGNVATTTARMDVDVEEFLASTSTNTSTSSAEFDDTQVIDPSELDALALSQPLDDNDSQTGPTNPPPAAAKCNHAYCGHFITKNGNLEPLRAMGVHYEAICLVGLHCDLTARLADSDRPGYHGNKKDKRAIGLETAEVTRIEDGLYTRHHVVRAVDEQNVECGWTFYCSKHHAANAVLNGLPKM